MWDCLLEEEEEEEEEEKSICVGLYTPVKYSLRHLYTD
jgi:hypothetical protein